MYKFKINNYTLVIFITFFCGLNSLRIDMTYMGRVQKNLSDHNLYKTHVSSGLKSMPNPELNCKENFVKCSNESHCIPKFLWCNGKIDCADASDEEMCSCLDKIDEEKICDGSFDCFNGEDELNCFGCGNNSFSCLDWTRRDPKGTCVSLSRRCDGISQCPNKKDELDCSILTQSYINEDPINSSYDNGYFLKNWKGKWYPVCPTTLAWASDACFKGTGIHAIEPPTITVDMKKQRLNLGPYIAMEPSGEIKLLEDCFAELAFVLCPTHGDLNK
ncbi:serine protease nudel [Microplitis demolitor]|uniref:serine protease nudel n=1 Tax=Microplitis demolitor TaxID=69319 RepID=UPI00235B6A87|nr:serine protease nudel [Microplitis demolitor]